MKEANDLASEIYLETIECSLALNRVYESVRFSTGEGGAAGR